jgi:hypothetical protein
VNFRARVADVPPRMFAKMSMLREYRALHDGTLSVWKSTQVSVDDRAVMRMSKTVEKNLETNDH